ncbi:MAG: FAD-dependent oxidoreductase [Carbonactinosporaceae bacterium]
MRFLAEKELGTAVRLAGGYGDLISVTVGTGLRFGEIGAALRGRWWRRRAPNAPGHSRAAVGGPVPDRVRRPNRPRRCRSRSSFAGWRRLIEGKQTLVEGLRSSKYVDIAESYDWPIRQGEASFEDYLVATGAAQWIPDIPGLDQVDHLTSTNAMELTEVPDSLLILGGGYVALEQAQLFARLGSKVTMLVRSRLASHEEPEVSQVLQSVFADEGIRVVRRAQVPRSPVMRRPVRQWPPPPAGHRRAQPRRGRGQDR